MVMEAVICDYLRSPFQRAHKGALADSRPEDMVSSVVRTSISRSGIEAADVEDLLLGCAYPEGVQGLNLGRIATYLSGLP
ncbi:MAG TPA: acetyl-CoA C-acyltransferase, partial [Candidatus Poseidoniales archaeon]|nr:acetyl-CoA C-acyltransferase [Candidatus Poseidoniales archaeon]